MSKLADIQKDFKSIQENFPKEYALGEHVAEASYQLVKSMSEYKADDFIEPNILSIMNHRISEALKAIQPDTAAYNAIVALQQKLAKLKNIQVVKQ